MDRQAKREELARLRRKNHCLREERDILREAAARIAREPDLHQRQFACRLEQGWRHAADHRRIVERIADRGRRVGLDLQSRRQHHLHRQRHGSTGRHLHRRHLDHILDTGREFRSGRRVKGSINEHHPDPDSGDRPERHDRHPGRSHHCA